MINKSLISIIMSVNKDDGTLSETIDSILNQTYPHFEFLIINDGCSHDVKKIINIYSDNRIKYFELSKVGLTACLNYGLDNAKGIFFARQDSGDISVNDRLEIQINYLQNNPEVKLIGTWIAEYSEDGDYLGNIEFPSSNNEIKSQLPFQNVFCHGSIMISLDVIKCLLGYREEFIKAQDIDLWLRVIEKYKVANINKVLYHRKVSKQSITIQTKKQQLQFAEIAKKCYSARISNKKEPLYLLNNINQHNISQKPSIKIINSNYYFY